MTTRPIQAASHWSGGIGTDPVAHVGNTSGGFVAVGISAIRAVPYGLNEPPGIVTPELFGAYRWPGLRR